MAEEKERDNRTLPFNETVMTLVLENNALLSVLMRAVGELLAEKRGRDVEEQISKLFEDVRQDRKRLIDVLSKEPD
jgi:hypothetical protein